MHLLISIPLIFGFCALLIVGLLRVLRDSVERDIFAPPQMADPDSRTNPYRYRSAGPANVGPANPDSANAASAQQQPPVSMRGGRRS